MQGCEAGQEALEVEGLGSGDSGQQGVHEDAALLQAPVGDEGAQGLLGRGLRACVPQPDVFGRLARLPGC